MTNNGLRSSVGVAATPFTQGPYTWDQALTISNNLTVTGNFEVDGTFTFGDAATDVLTVHGKILGDGTAVANFIKFTGSVGTATDGTLFSTGSSWISHATAGQCAFKILAANAATSGDYATMRIRGRADAVSSGGTEGINVSASANIANYGDLCSGYFAVQPNAITNNSASNIVTAVHAVIDRTGASSGRTWVAWIDTHQQTKSDAGDYLMRLSHNGTVANDGAITIYTGGRMPTLINFEIDSLNPGSMLSTATGTATITHKIACTISGVGTVYIPLASGIA